MELRKLTCSECKSHLHYMERMPVKQKGVTMHFGDRFCLGGKKPRRFGRGDPKIYVPTWCPKRKVPSELRIYGFKNTEEWMMHHDMCEHLGKDIAPSAFRYAVAFELHTPLTPREFAKRCNEEPDAETLGIAVHRHYVVEIDDGIKPTFFYKTEKGYELLGLSAFFYCNSVRRMRSRIMKLCVLGGLGNFPQQAFGAMWIATSIASRFLYRFSVPSCLSSLPIRKSSRTIHAGFLQICGYSYIIYFALLCRLKR